MIFKKTVALFTEHFLVKRSCSPTYPLRQVWRHMWTVSYQNFNISLGCCSFKRWICHGIMIIFLLEKLQCKNHLNKMFDLFSDKCCNWKDCNNISIPLTSFKRVEIFSKLTLLFWQLKENKKEKKDAEQ